MRAVVLHSNLLWNTGISKDRKSVGFQARMLNITEISKSIGFTEEQIVIIYEKMKSALDDLYHFVYEKSKDSVFRLLNKWTAQLGMMKQFLVTNKAILKTQDDYKAIWKKVLLLIRENCGGKTITEMLLDDNNSKEAIYFLELDITPKNIRNYQDAYSVIANKIIMKNTKYLNSYLIHFTWIMSQLQNHLDKSFFKPLVAKILLTYRPYFKKHNPNSWDIQYAEKDIIEQQLIYLSKVLSQWGEKPVVFWTNYQPIYYR